MKKVSLLDLYFVFLITGLELLGGGFVIIPVLSKNIINKKDWISKDDLTKYYALAQSLPGIIAVNVSGFVGYQIRGKMGALVSILGVITTPFIIICLIANILSQLTDLTLLQNIFYGVGLAVVVLIYLAVKEMWEFSVVDFPSLIIFLGSLCASFFFEISPVLIVLGAILYGTLMKAVRGDFKK